MPEGNRKVKAVAALVVLAVIIWLVVLIPKLMKKQPSVEECEADCVMNMRVYLNAQHLFFRKDWDNDGFSEFAADLDRLYEPELPDDGVWTKPLISKSLAEADDDDKVAAVSGLRSGIPRKGYLYHDLVGVRSNGEERDFKVDGGNGDGYTDGFGLLGYPAEYGKTGRRKFVIGPDGIVYARDEGNNTPFDYFPDVEEGWEPVTR